VEIILTEDEAKLSMETNSITIPEKGKYIVVSANGYKCDGGYLITAKLIPFVEGLSR